ncbi:MAG: glycosyl hydrolase family 28-related protein [Capsulimonadales bacterium]|nr:glycosyl hydrolase family 28-related protein [Capsulimonadales bacterium]
MNALIPFLILHAVSFSTAKPPSPRYVFPKDPAVLDAKRDFGAKGDGIADDTDALQRGLDASCGADGKPTRVLFLPNGVYRLTRTLVVKRSLGPWLYGESRDGVILRPDDGLKDYRSVLRTHPNEDGPTSADWFMRNLRHFTVDVGKNPETDGIRYYATNSGILKDVRVIGHGKIGINAGFLGQSGPNLIQDVTVEGFETGIQSQWIWGETLSRVTVRRCRKQGVYVSANAVGIEDLTVEETPIALFCDYPNDWTWWGGVVALVGGRFSGNDPKSPAIRNRSVLYARNVTTRGFGKAIESDAEPGSVAGPKVAEFVFPGRKRLFEGPADAPLPIKREPEIPWETDLRKWVCANDFGAVAGDNQDDTDALRKAIDAAAARKATVVYLRGVGGPDPNWYNVNGTVRVHGSVRFLLGLGFGRIIGGENGRFVIDDDSAPVVRFQNIDSFGGPGVIVENRSTNRTLVAESCGIRVLGTGKGDIFLTDCPSTLEIVSPGQRVWARHFNPEGNSDTGLVRNEGGLLWALGVKCEGKGVRFRTAKGGRTEIYGMFNYGSGMDPKDLRPMFEVEDARFRIAGLREIVFEANPWPVKVREKHGTETRTLGSDREGGWIGWSLFDSKP